MKLDDTDKAIIEVLQDDGRMPFSTLGPRVGLSPPAVRQRVLHLIEEGVMQVVAVTDPTTLGFTVQAMVGIEVEGPTEPVAGALAAIDEVDYVVVVTGRFDVLIEIVAEDSEALMTSLATVRSLPGVRRAEIFVYLRLEKQTYNWGTR
ncbi:MAG: Lrp/AsnC family transcriptional regulator [Acidimicrobiia bacterium]|jgi:Lrp/AsnC family transcriptional regulator for asnA, asnC and gidA|nr:MAG: Lrp/AsnC family transcriptional regulator [Acidimicrobiia bacterium]